MPENSRNERTFVPAGERIATLEVHVSAIREDMGEVRGDIATIKQQMFDLLTEKTSQHAYVQIGKVVWGIFERIMLMLFSSAVTWWLQRHGPGGR